MTGKTRVLSTVSEEDTVKNLSMLTTLSILSEAKDLSLVEREMSAVSNDGAVLPAGGTRGLSPRLRRGSVRRALRPFASSRPPKALGMTANLR
jgi:hypothetical protein